MSPGTPDPDERFIASSAADQRSGLRENHLLSLLPDDELDRLHPLLEPVILDFKDQVYEAGGAIKDVYFPTAGVLSQVAQLDGETAIEVTTIGREGMAGLPAFLGAHTSPDEVFCQVPGRGQRLSTAALHEYLTDAGPLRRLLNLYTQATLNQLARTVACNRLHTMEERMSRWLLMTRDRVDDDTFPLTQEFLSQMLGVRRATVSLSAGVLQAAGLIGYTRGQITIRDRDALEEASCDCYRVVREESERLLGEPI